MARPLKALPAIEITEATSLERNAVSNRVQSSTDEFAKPSRSERDAAKAEFDSLKLQYASRSDLVSRVAGFLVVLSRQNVHEGRDAAIIYDSLDDSVSLAIGLKPDDLSRALVLLQGLGLVGLNRLGTWHLRDIDGLERLADHKHDGAATPQSRRPAGAAGHLDIAKYMWRNTVCEVRELAWLLAYMTALSLISVGIGLVAAVAML
jgi:hypothetical protein